MPRMAKQEEDDFEIIRQYDKDSVIATLAGVTVRTGGGLVILESEQLGDRMILTLGQARLLIAMVERRDVAFASALRGAIERCKNAGARMRDA